MSEQFYDPKFGCLHKLMSHHKIILQIEVLPIQFKSFFGFTISLTLGIFHPSNMLHIGPETVVVRHRFILKVIIKVIFRILFKNLQNLQ